MEWMLQVVDEIDDVFGMMGHYTAGLRGEWRLLLAGSLGIGAALLVTA